MSKFIDNSTIKETVDYFRGQDYGKPEQIGLYLFFKAIGLNEFVYTKYEKWGNTPAAERSTYMRTLFDLSGMFSAANETAGKFTSLFPFSITHYYKPNCFYNGGSPFKVLGSRVSDTFDNSLVSTLFQRSDKDKSMVKTSPNCIELLKKSHLKGGRIPLRKITAWYYKFWKLEIPADMDDKLVSDLLVLKFLIDFHISANEYQQLFFLDDFNIEYQNSVITGAELRKIVDFSKGEAKPEVTNEFTVDYMTLYPLVSENDIKELIAQFGKIVDNEHIIEFLSKRDNSLKERAIYEKETTADDDCDIDYAWYVGATGNDDDGVYTDFSDKYIEEGRWENRYDSKYTKQVNLIKVGDRIVIKSSYTKKRGLPFDSRGKTVGVMGIKAIGTVTKNYFDGKNIDVEWTRVEPLKEWYGDGVLRTTLHCVRAKDSYIKKALLMFTFYDMPQDYSIYDEPDEEELFEEDVENQENIFMTFPMRNARTNKIHQLNTILYGAPGTGKTYSTAEYSVAICEKRAVRDGQLSAVERASLMDKYGGLISSGRVVFTTFHQSYGYEDFIQGLRPDTKSETMKFRPVDGVFKKIADRAMIDEENNYVIIIDEINRGNISKIFGELITLIEDDKRWGEANQLSVVLPSGQPFAVPNNLYIIGTMNSADKSISLIDTALRRRFYFIEKAPDYSVIENATLKDVLVKLNQYIKAELRSTDLLIGHAFFIGKTESDLVGTMNGQIIPLLYEYFYDDEARVKRALDCLEGTNVTIDTEYQGRVRVK